MEFSSFCISSFLAFQYVINPSCEWARGLKPKNLSRGRRTAPKIPVSKSSDLTEVLRRNIKRFDFKETGLFLDFGIESAILAALLPEGARAYTLRYLADGGEEGSLLAKKYAEIYGLNLALVDVSWEDCLAHMNSLMAFTRSPPQAHEVAIYLAAQEARRDGLKGLLCPGATDLLFGRMAGWLERQWDFESFFDRFMAIHPDRVVSDPFDMRFAFEPFRREDGLDVAGVLRGIYLPGVTNSYEAPIQAAGCVRYPLYESIRVEGALNPQRVRPGEAQMLLNDTFADLYPGLSPPERKNSTHVLEQWLSDWEGPHRPEFKPNLDMSEFNGKQKWLMYSLERFMDYNERQRIK